jgi:hypothetical protein
MTALPGSARVEYLQDDQPGIPEIHDVGKRPTGVDCYAHKIYDGSALEDGVLMKQVR